MPLLPNDLAERLVALEADLAAARAEIAVLQRDSQTKGRVRTAAVVASVAVVMSSVGWGVTHADESGHVVSTPFIVRDSGGKTVLRVDDADGLNQLALLNADGKGVTALLADQYGGRFLAAGPDGKTRASIGLSELGDGGLALWDADDRAIADIMKGEKGGRGLGVYDDDGVNKIEVATQPTNKAAIIRVKSADQPKATMLFVDTNNSGLFVRDPATGKVIASLGLESPDPGEDGKLVPARNGLTVFSTEGKPIVKAFQNTKGHGTVAVIDKSDETWSAELGVTEDGPALAMNAPGGAQHLALAVFNGAPTLEMKNKAGNSIFQLTEGIGGAGRLEIGNPDGFTTVEAGTLKNGHGIVRVYPWQGTNPLAMLGLPGTYIVGHGDNGEGK